MAVIGPYTKVSTGPKLPYITSCFSKNQGGFKKLELKTKDQLDQSKKLYKILQGLGVVQVTVTERWP